MPLKSMEGMSARAEINEHCCRDTRVDLSSSHKFEEEISASSSEDRLLIPKMEFSNVVRRPDVMAAPLRLEYHTEP